jgi:AcrR family transcriptional regulator
VTSSTPQPVQRRRALRVQAILDAAEEILSEQGYEAATLKAIGERAGIPTASVYYYFADRHQVDAQLLERNLGSIAARVTAALEGPGVRTLRDAVDAIVDAIVAYFREHPSLVELWFNGRTNGDLAELGHAWDEDQAEQFWHFLVDRQLIAADTPRLAVRLVFEAGDRLFDVAFRRSPTGDEAVLEMARRMLTAFLESYAP